MGTTEEILKAFNIPDWYFPSKTEIARLQAYLKRRNQLRTLNGFDFWTVPRFCDENDCFFCNGTVQSAASPKFE